MTPFRCEALDNGVTVEFFDRSHRYFGDYHRIRVEVRLQVSRPGSDSPLVKTGTLERMGVPGAATVTIRDRLADDYWRHVGRYLSHPGYPERLLAAETHAPRRQLLAGLPVHAP